MRQAGSRCTQKAFKASQRVGWLTRGVSLWAADVAIIIPEGVGMVTELDEANGARSLLVTCQSDYLLFCAETAEPADAINKGT